MNTVDVRNAGLAVMLMAMAIPAAAQESGWTGIPLENVRAFLDQRRIARTEERVDGDGLQMKLIARYSVQFSGELCNGTTVFNPDYRISCPCQLTLLSDDGQRVARVLRDPRHQCWPPPDDLLGPN